MQERTSSSSSLRFPRRRPWWFQVEGFFDRERRRWTPFFSMPEALEPPGPLNLHERGDIAPGELESIIERWHRVRWPRMTRSVRRFYVESRRRSSRRFRDILWARLSALEDFDRSSIRRRFGVDDEFRMDAYGNVLARNAERFSRTSWNVDHIVPWSRGGLTQLSNLRIINERANIVVKKARIEQTIPRKEMQVGVLVSQLRELEKDKGNNLYDYLTKEIDSTVREELLTHEEQWAAEDTWFETVCDYCQKELALHVCSNCEQAQFCSTECFAAEWSYPFSLHRIECKKIK